jgi:hypothetical protein
MYFQKTKILLVLGLALIILGCQSKSVSLNEAKHNYNSFILYDDPYVDKILNYKRYIRSTFILSGNIKSLHTIDSLSESGIQASIKYFYDLNKDITRMVNYDAERNEVMDRSFYRWMNFGGETLIKKGIFHQIDKEIKSYDDTLNKTIVIETFENGMLKEVDSIVYERDYYPTTIKKYDANNQLASIYKIEYDNNKTSLNLLARKTGHHQGVKRVFDENNRHLYVSDLSQIDFNSLAYEIEEEKKELMIWNEGSFQFYKSEKDTTYWDADQNQLKRIFDSSITTTYFSDKILPVSSSYLENDTGDQQEISFIYNEFKDLIEVRFENDSPLNENEKYIYEYDSKNNWVKRQIFINEKHFKTTLREIEYY